MPLPPKPKARAGRVSIWRYARLFRQDILSAQPAQLYRAWMAEFRTPFFRSFLVNQPDLVKQVLGAPIREMPKSTRVGEGLRPLLGNSIFLANGEVWARQRRIIDPAFEGGRLRETFPGMLAAAEGAVARLHASASGAPVEIEEVASHAAADVIFRTLFSRPIEDRVAAEVFQEFRRYQRSAPILNLGALFPLPGWFPRGHRRSTRRSATRIRELIRGLVEDRRREIEAGMAPQDLATKIMTTPDSETGETFGNAEMADQVAIFFLAGHETSASTLAWALYLVATHEDVQNRIRRESQIENTLDLSSISRLKFTRDVVRETLRLYPPVPMLVREPAVPLYFRERPIRAGDQVVISPWHLHRHERLWRDPDAFDPDRWADGDAGRCPREAFLPFSAGPRVCPGAGFAMAESVLLLSSLTRAFRFEPVEGRIPEPVAHLTVRARDGIWLRVRSASG